MRAERTHLASPGDPLITRPLDSQRFELRTLEGATVGTYKVSGAELPEWLTDFHRVATSVLEVNDDEAECKFTVRVERLA